mmetsp:Transcript_11858/g.24487  ORF Transcript_11858/g.24487 Transcript_11858/m.24487 type:complete len:541 (+) Transcript_11858:59-1681(+)|eukprot:CAMPEP_0197279906 /NCGR_PEP_ID=MMETSP1432-20130617/20760_1 /TAXON_ID=44447 /ORGANISM="Pseudo-nitzschia delicatissima, Strain UNC1205" /LENGTH=540 /DNA_ID=CAMNT_0042746511 /DNA_START=57 /DNA_END=1679 /DNA_ORIENTATION=-
MSRYNNTIPKIINGSKPQNYGSMASRVPDSEDDQDGQVAVRRRWQDNPIHHKLRTLAGVMGNVLEWYDFAVFGFFSDVIGRVFFPKDQSEDLSVMESFAVFGGAFLMRPVGGLMIGYIGDTSGRKKALEISIFLMASATTLMGCLPTYDQIGNGAILLLLMVRMLQGLSVGGQLMSSLVFTLEGRPSKRWGLYGSFVLATANIGTLLGGLVAYGLRLKLTDDQIYRWGWRIPFLSGILISFCGIYLKYFCTEEEGLPGHEGPDHEAIPSYEDSTQTPESSIDHEIDDVVIVEGEMDDDQSGTRTTLDEPPKLLHQVNPLRLAFSKENRRSLLASSMIPLLWAGGFYLSFVWMAIFMEDLISPPVPSAFLVNSISSLILCLWFPLAGGLSDILGRRRVMTVGGVLFGFVGPFLFLAIRNTGGANAWNALFAQIGLGFSLAMWGAPMCAWLVESFDPAARLTSVSIGYNIGQALAGGFSPFLATLLVEKIGTAAPAILLTTLATVSLVGLWRVAPRHDYDRQSQEEDSEDTGEVDLHLNEIT